MFPNLTGADWKGLPKHSIQRHNGLKVSSRLVRLTRPINLRSHALKLNLDVLLAGDSQLNIITRSALMVNEEVVVIRLSKYDSTDGQRLFLMFGVLDQASKEVVMIKKTEIPVYKQIENEMCVSLELIDNGTDTLAITGVINRHMRNTFRVICDKVMIPTFEDFNLFLYGGGVLTLVKSFRLDIIERLADESFQKNPKEADCHSCCSIF